MSTPMMKQYEEAKAACGDALLLFRMGDFYELFQEDAKRGAELLGLTLTSRDKSENPIPMAGFPHHQLENYLGKLVRMGQRVAICEQVEDPKKATGLVRREVTRVVTPGTLTDDGLLDPRESNYLAAVSPIHETRSADDASQGTVGLAWTDLSTGDFQAACIALHQLSDEIARIHPVEILLPDGFTHAVEVSAATVTRRPDWTYSKKLAQQRLTQQFGTHNLEGFGFTTEDQPAIQAAGGILEYLDETQKTNLDHIDTIAPYRPGTSLEIDESSRRSLEISRTLQDGHRDGSLLSVLDHTVTGMGSRMLGQWLAAPLTQPDRINLRLDAVSELISNLHLAEDIRKTLRETYDLQRLLARVSTGRASPRDLSFIGRTLERLPGLKQRLQKCRSQLLSDLQDRLDLCPDIHQELSAALVEECPLNSREGGILREGYRPELDQLRELAVGGKQWIANYQAEQMQHSGIPSLKVGYNKVFGYYIEVTNAHKDAVPEHFIRRQTLKNAERYVTPELKQYEEKVLVADEKAKELEYELFVSLRERVQAAAPRLQQTAQILAQLDVLASFSELARRRGYCRPEPLEDPVIEILEGRHPVLDVREPDGTFVPNDTYMHTPDQQVLLITGPNMAGKSTYIRQVALVTLMMQVGSFVPAKSARIGIADRIFARVGASDRLSRGQSTFMVEMTEAARILNGASVRSLVILDEIGRGTSTYDGVSLAWAILEHLHNHIGCRTLFATHYHELTDLELSLSGVSNLNVLVKEWEDNIAFLHKIVPGAADKSYGIHVARLAGVPNAVQQRAKQILEQLEEHHLEQVGMPTCGGIRAKPQPDIRRAGNMQLTLFDVYEHPLLDQIRELDCENLTPFDALQMVRRWQQELS